MAKTKPKKKRLSRAQRAALSEIGRRGGLVAGRKRADELGVEGMRALGRLGMNRRWLAVREARAKRRLGKAYVEPESEPETT